MVMDVVNEFGISNTLDIMENNTKWCRLDNVIEKTKKLSILLWLEFAISFASFFANVLFIIMIRRIPIMPVNIRYLLAHLSFNFVWLSVALMIKSALLLVTPLCFLEMNAFDCRLRELVLTLPGSAIFYSLLGICVERLCSTFYKRNRDHASTPPYLAVVFFVIIWTATLISNLDKLSNVPRDRSVHVCEAFLSLDAANATTSIVANLFLEIAAIVVMFMVTMYEKYVWKNIAINRVKYTLSSRFCIVQNVEVNAFMFPSMLLHALCFIPLLTFYMLIVLGVPMRVSTQWFLIHSTYLWRQVYCLCHPIIAFSRNFHMKKQLKNNKLFRLLTSTWRRSRAKVAVVYHDEFAMRPHAAAHFEQLKEMWEVRYRDRRRPRTIVVNVQSTTAC